MGVTVHYRGAIEDLSRIEDMEDRVVDLALDLGADVQVWRSTSDRDPRRVVRGVFLTLAPGQEPTSLLVAPEGWLIGLADIEAAENGEFSRPPWCFVKTQFGDVESHVALVELLAALKKNFLTNLEVHDEGGYWESRDLPALVQRFDQTRRAIDALARGLKHFALTDEAAEDPAILVTRIERVARQVRQTLARPAEHPPLHFANDTDDEALMDPDQDEADWDEMFKHNRRNQERIGRAIEERIARGEEHGEAFDNAMRDELALDLPADPDFPESEEEVDHEFAGDDDQSPDATETNDSWPEDSASDAGDAADPPSAATDDAIADADEFERTQHPLQRRAFDLMHRLHDLSTAAESARGGYWDTLLRGAGDIMGGLAQAMRVADDESDWEPPRGLRIVQLKRALRGAAFARGALAPLAASGGITEATYEELGETLRNLNADIQAELASARQYGQPSD